ncbi:hypothetical protein HOI71_04040, partial [Candidatus Poribacteria bacterium]|nr:hypothetical protein [Candidatus Poribacteria bacterium]
MPNLALVGPGGTGKTPLSEYIQADAVLESHRVRDNPRDSSDMYYLSKPALEGIGRILDLHEPAPRRIESPDKTRAIQVYGDHTAVFEMRGWPQVLFLPSIHSTARQRRVEVYAPILHLILSSDPVIWPFNTQTFVLLLTPWERTLSELKGRIGPDEESAVEAQLGSCGRRDRPDSIKARVGSLHEELAAWDKLRALCYSDTNPHVFVEAAGWEYSEYRYFSYQT